mmetsp:Transcript_73572/g.185476  ORF Transcript_73572/g.185476 Transcript_73572/m.185476 type:complete len:169 (-) Transcript_73572:160-666(-)
MCHPALSARWPVSSTSTAFARRGPPNKDAVAREAVAIATATGAAALSVSYTALADRPAGVELAGQLAGLAQDSRSVGQPAAAHSAGPGRSPARPSSIAAAPTAAPPPGGGRPAAAVVAADDETRGNRQRQAEDLRVRSRQAWHMLHAQSVATRAVKASTRSAATESCL